MRKTEDERKRDAALWRLYMLAREINQDLPTGDDLAGKTVVISFSKDGISAVAR